MENNEQKQAEKELKEWAEIINGIGFQVPTENKNAPHQANVHITVTTNEIDPQGKVIPIPITQTTFLHSFIGKNLEDAEEQANNFLKGLEDEETTGKSTPCKGKGCRRSDLPSE